jgi:hypothetical protein
MSCTRTIIRIYYNKLPKKLFQNSFVWKIKLEKKGMQSFCKVIMLAHCILFAPDLFSLKNSQRKLLWQGYALNPLQVPLLDFPQFHHQREWIIIAFQSKLILESLETLILKATKTHGVLFNIHNDWWNNKNHFIISCIFPTNFHPPCPPCKKWESLNVVKTS